MRSPALALGWELWARNRRGLLAVLAVVGFYAVCMQALGTWYRVDRIGALLYLVNLPLPLLTLIAYVYLLSVFAQADMLPGGKPQGYPSRLFVLPVRTRWLVGLPMLYGTATIFALVLFWDLFALLMSESFWQNPDLNRLRYFNWDLGFFLAAFLAVTQAAAWTLARTALSRLALVVVGFPSAGIAILLAKHTLNIDWDTVSYHLYVSPLIWVCTLLIVCAYIVAVVGVARDRRGDRLNWAAVGIWLLRTWPRLPARTTPFTSADAAERWLEARRHAWLLPSVMVLFFVVLLWGTLLSFSDVDVARIVGAFIGAPAVVGFFVGFSMGKTSFWSRDLQLSPLTALRPMSCARLVRAKLEAAGLSVLLTWAIVLILAPTWALVSGYDKQAAAVLRAALADLSAWRLVLLVPVALVGLIGWTWLQMVGGMCLSLTGRVPVVNGVIALYAIIGAVVAGLSIGGDSSDTALRLLWILGCVFGLLKLGVLYWVWNRVGAEPDRALPRLAFVWLATAVCLVITIKACWPEALAPTNLIAFYLVVSLPLARPIALPAAVAWNRHR